MVYLELWFSRENSRGREDTDESEYSEDLFAAINSPMPSFLSDSLLDAPVVSPRHKQAINFAAFLAVGSLADIVGDALASANNDKVMGDCLAINGKVDGSVRGWEKPGKLKWLLQWAPPSTQKLVAAMEQAITIDSQASTTGSPTYSNATSTLLIEKFPVRA